MSSEVEKISAQGCGGCTIRDIHALLRGTVINSANAGSIMLTNGKKKKKKINGESDAHSAHKEFQNATSLALMGRIFTNHECLPSLDSAYIKFKEVYGTYEVLEAVDEIREQEYEHLQSNNHVCMDYYGFGLFSHLQYQNDPSSSSFGLIYSSANLPSQAMYGIAAEGTVEFDIRNRIMQFLKIREKDYSMVFTASRGSAFKLLAESYPFHVNKRLLSVYDYESEGVNSMVECAQKKGAKILSALFRWPSLRMCSNELKKVLITKKKSKEASAKGLFVFPVQSRVTGGKYSYQWISQAQHNGWHVLLDASALGPKDMDSLGLSLFLPDFVICSFYKVYGENPTGFGCLFIKNSVISCLHTSSTARGVGMVKIVPIYKTPSSRPVSVEDDDIQGGLCTQTAEDIVEELEDPEWGLKNKQLLTMKSFSGPISVINKELLPETGIDIYESVRSETDYSHKCDTGSVTEIDFGSEPMKIRHHHVSSSVETPGPVMIEDLTGAADDMSSEKGNSCTEFERRSNTLTAEIVEEKTALEEDKEGSHIFQKGTTITEEQYSVSAFPFLDSDLGHAEEENMYLCKLRGNIPTKYSELHRDRGWFRGETSGMDVETPIEEEDVTKFTGYSYSSSSAMDHGREKGKPFDEAMLQEETEYMESESMDASGVLMRSEPQIFCRSLDQADSLGLNRTRNRLRLLINWVVNALLQLRHPCSEKGIRLVEIYGPKVKFDRGAAVAFNLYDWKAELIEPLLVQRLADRNNISLGYGVLQNIWFPDKYEDKIRVSETKYSVSTTTNEHPKREGKPSGIAVVTAALGFVSNFEDVYRLWAFVARFLDADFVLKERWKYRGLNQKTFEV